MAQTCLHGIHTRERCPHCEALAHLDSEVVFLVDQAERWKKIICAKDREIAELRACVAELYNEGLFMAQEISGAERSVLSQILKKGELPGNHPLRSAAMRLARRGLVRHGYQEPSMYERFTPNDQTRMAWLESLSPAARERLS